MSIGSLSFWQQNQNYWAHAQRSSQNQSLRSAVINQMFNATTNRSYGLSTIANGTALHRVNSQLTAAIQNALQGNSGDASSSGSGKSSTSGAAGSSTSSSPSSSAARNSSPASGTGTAPLMKSTSLFTLGILAKGQVIIGAGNKTTTYTATGTDTVGDLINGINVNAASGGAEVAASLNSSGRLVITSTNTTDTITVQGIYAANLGFGVNNDTFAPVKRASGASPASSSLASAASSSGGSSAAASGSKAGSASAPSRIPLNSAYTLQTNGTAEILLAGNGLAGNILNMLT